MFPELLIAGAVPVVFSFGTFTVSRDVVPTAVGHHGLSFSSYILYMVPWVPYILRREGRCRIDVAESGVNLV